MKAITKKIGLHWSCMAVLVAVVISIYGCPTVSSDVKAEFTVVYNNVPIPLDNGRFIIPITTGVSKSNISLTLSAAAGSTIAQYQGTNTITLTNPVTRGFDFSAIDSLKFKVTSADGGTPKDYIVKVANLSNAAEITALTLTINGTDNTVTFTSDKIAVVSVSGTVPTTATVKTITLSPKATANVQAGGTVPITDGKIVISVTGEDGTKNVYTVSVSKSSINFTKVGTPTGFGNRLFHASVFYDNKVWVIGGANGSPSNDVWSSSDGNNWTKVTFQKKKNGADSTFTPRYAHAVVAFNRGKYDSLWVIGGFLGNYSSNNEVWKSKDGTAWERDTIKPSASTDVSTTFDSRGMHTAVVHNGKVYVIGGNSTGLSLFSDVWSSSDMKKWTKISSGAFPARQNHASLSFGGRLWVIGGNKTASFESNPLVSATKFVGGLLNDVWSSTDGITWTKVTDKAAFPERCYHTSFVYNNRMWILGGQYGTLSTSSVTLAALDNVGVASDTWSSTDGLTWTLENAVAVSKRAGHTTVVNSAGNKIWVIGGDAGTNNGLSLGSQLDDVWIAP